MNEIVVAFLVYRLITDQLILAMITTLQTMFDLSKHLNNLSTMKLISLFIVAYTSW